MLQSKITPSDVTMLTENYITCTCVSIDDFKLKILSQLNEVTNLHFIIIIIIVIIAKPSRGI